MKYKNEDDNRYRVQFMRATEQLMDKLSVKAFIFYLKTNAEFEDYDYIRIDGKQVRVGVYDLKEEGSTLHKDTVPVLAEIVHREVEAVEE